MIMIKHAYLIMAHDNMDQLKRLISILDDRRNDIFVHIDLKYKQLNREEIIDSAVYSKVVLVDRTNVVWGSYDQIRCELILLKTAVANGEYSYLHLLSGSDLPIKSQNFIHDFFDSHEGEEFVHFETESLSGTEREKVSLYHSFQSYVGSTKNSIYYLQRLLIRIQRFFRVDRLSNSQTIFCKGANWFSITYRFAQYILSREKWIYTTFKDTLCADEIFLQTLLYNSEFKNNLFYSKYDNNYVGCMRLILWDEDAEKAHPHQFDSSDVEILKESDRLFARKFGPEVNGLELIRTVTEG